MPPTYISYIMASDIELFTSSTVSGIHIRYSLLIVILIIVLVYIIFSIYTIN